MNTEAKYQALFESIDEGFCIIEVIFDRHDKAVDYRFLEVNPAFERQTGLTAAHGRTVREMAPGHEEHWFETYGRIARTGEPARFELPAVQLNRFYDVYAWRYGEAHEHKVAVLFKDVGARKQVEAALRESEERYRALVNTAPVVLWTTDAEGRCTMLSRGWTEMTGQAEGEALGHGWTAPVHPDDRARTASIFQRANEKREPFSLDYRLRRADGEYRWATDAGRPRFGASGEFLGFIGSVNDVHERKGTEAQLQAELADAELLRGISAELINEDDSAALYGKIMEAAVAIMRSQYASLQMLYPERGVGGELRLLAFRGFNPQAAQFWEWVRADSESTCGAALRTGKRVIAADVEKCEVMAGTQDLATYLQTGIHAVQTTPLFSRGGKLVGMISTHWREPHQPSERDLRLLDILARQAADLIERKGAEEALREADRRKDEFIATLSHELRNPLAPLSNSLELLGLTGAAGQSAQIHDMMRRQVNHLVRLTDDLLEISRVTRGALELRRERVELAAVVRNALETSDPLLRAGGRHLELELPPEPLWLDGDPVRLAQVLANLLNNSARYTAANGRIELRARREGGNALITVRDDGAGIAAEELPRVFEMFSRGERSSGLGIGLALARRLAEMHGGSISAASAGPAQGAEFSVRLPLAAQPGALPGPAAAKASPLAHQRVLVVDDNRDAAESLGMLLKFLGADVEVANGGREALAAFDARRPAVVLLDIGMPGMDGYQVAREIRGREDGTRVPLVALTGWGQDDDLRRAREAGFDHHMIKPPDIGALRSLLGSVRASPT